MHELAMVRSIYEVINEKVTEYGVKRVKQVKLIVGELTGIEESIMKSCFEIYVQRTPAEGANLIIEYVPIRVMCRDCSHEFETSIPFSDCPHCGTKKFHILSGKELYIESMEVE
ncbi:hydrogenase maturation nickel metallochaperone HypA [Bacillus tuaregi]|uniref:hydrogenase maturation nickel metallochaperone HypA n=1 Tax=Bacillus tuaregi TaxID=1816695 RepID=UPI0008F80B38|nr:hydrogenase maturation nickel metallochaperone HypA [Bacillus tuaregi]